LIESKEAENQYKNSIERFNSKFEELQNIIDNMKHIIIEKDITIKKFQKRIETQTKSTKEEAFLKEVYIIITNKFL